MLLPIRSRTDQRAGSCIPVDVAGHGQAPGPSAAAVQQRNGAQLGLEGETGQLDEAEISLTEFRVRTVEPDGNAT
jgi:hypothetical protein